MSDGLKNIGSNTFRQILKTLTKNRISAILVGAGITCLVRSSSATSVMVVGFVNAGLLSLTQAIAVVLGADVGTTVTAWLVSVMEMCIMDTASVVKKMSDHMANIADAVVHDL